MSESGSVLFVDNARCLDPYELYRDLAALGHSTDFFGMANRVECPLGFEPGSAWCLMREEDVAAMSDQYHTLTWLVAGGSVRFNSYVYWAAREVVPDFNGNGAYLVELRDKRQVLKMSTVDKSYNVRRRTLPWSFTDTDDAYYNDTLKAGSAWSWTDVLSDLWQTLPSGARGTTPTIPTTPTLVPVDMNFNGSRTWTEALPRFLSQLLCTISLDPTRDALTIVELGKEQPGLTSVSDQLRDDGALMKEDFPFGSGAKARVPEKIKVFFPKRLPAGFGEELADGADGGVATGQYYSVEKTTAVDNVEAGTVASYRVDQVAEYKKADGTLANTSQLDTFAEDLKNSIVNHFDFNGPFFSIYKLILGQLSTGSQVGRVVWRDYGDGWGPVTEVHGRPFRLPEPEAFGGFEDPSQVELILGPEEFIVKNGTGGDLPSGSVVRRTTTGTSHQVIYYSVDKPDDTLRRRYVVTLGKIGDGKYGRATWAERAAIVLFDDASGTPTDGEEWGPKKDQTRLTKDYYGFRALGGVIGSGAESRGMFQGHEIVEAIGKPDSVPWNKDSPKDVKIFTKNFDTDTLMKVLQVQNYSQNVTNLTDKIVVSWPAGGPIGSKLNCS